MPASSADLTQAEVGSEPVRRLETSDYHVGQGNDFPAILCALNPSCMEVTGRSPVDITIVGPDGKSLSRLISEIAGASFREIEDTESHSTTKIIIPFPLPGDYTISLVPKAEALPTDTYTIEVTQKGETIVLAQNQQVQNIPSQGYAVTVLPPNQIPVANAGTNQTVRLGSLVTLNGGGSSDPDNGPGPLTFSWTKVSGPAVTLSGATTATPTFTPTVAGTYRFSLVVNDGQDSSAPASVAITVPIFGDLNLDGKVNVDDLKLLTAALNSSASGPNDIRDLNGDGRIDGKDVPELVKRCTGPGCGP